MNTQKTKYLFLLAALFLSISLNAQKTSRTGYFMKTLDRSSLNPALRPEHGYVGFPFLGNIYVSGMTNTLNLDHFIFSRDGGNVTFLHRDVSINDFINGMKDNNYLSGDSYASILSAGWYRGDGFWTVDFGVKAHVDGNLPKSLFEFAKTGYRTDPYYMKDARVIGNGYGELAVGYSRPFLDNTLLVGAKAKVLIGLADFDAQVDELTLRMSPDQWVATSHATIKGAVPGLSPKYNDDGEFDGFDYDSEFKLSGYGFGVDLGAEYSLSAFSDVLPILDKFKVSAAFNDIGFISWSKSNALRMSTDSSEPIYIAGENAYNPDPDDPSLQNQWDNVLDNLENAINFQEDAPKSYTTSLRMNMNWAVEYEILKDKLSAGLLSSTYFNHSHTQSELTVSGNYMPLKWLATSLSYSFMYSNFQTFGFAFHLAPSKGLNFFFASDYIIPHVNSDWIPTTSKGVNVQFGLSFPLGGKK